MSTQMNSLTIARLNNVIEMLGKIKTSSVRPQEVGDIALSIEIIQDIIQHN